MYYLPEGNFQLRCLWSKFVDNSIAPVTFLTMLFVTMLLPSHSAYGTGTEQVIDVQNDEVDVTLFRGAANNSYFPVYFKALPEKGAEKVSAVPRVRVRARACARACACARVRARARACACARVRACAHARVRACVCPVCAHACVRACARAPRRACASWSVSWASR